MKYLKYILGAVVILILIFLSLGILKPEVSYDCETVVEKPLTESWAVGQDPDKMGEWLPDFIKMKHISGTPGTVGAVSDVYFDNAGTEMKIRETITSIGPNESIEMTFTSDFMDMDYKMTMIDEGGKTRIKSHTVTRGNSLLFKSIMAWTSGAIKAQEDTNLEMLKKAIEANTKNYSLNN